MRNKLREKSIFNEQRMSQMNTTFFEKKFGGQKWKRKEDEHYQGNINPARIYR